MRAISIYSAYFVQFLKARLEYRGDFFASLLANSLVAISGLLFIVFLIDGENVADLQGWQRAEILLIYGLSMISMSLFQIVSRNLYRFGEQYIIEGKFDRVLLRPLGSIPQVLFESFNLESLGSMLVGVLLFFTSASTLNLELGVLDYAWLLISALSGGIILVAVFVFLASLSFHFEDRLGIGAPVFSMIAFSRYPLPIFNQAIQFILRWIIPFGFIAFYPATHFLQRDSFRFYCYFTPVMALLASAVAFFGWRFGVSRYTSTGN